MLLKEENNVTKEELKKLGYRPTKNGMFMINREADIWRVCDKGTFEKAAISISNEKYKVAICNLDNKQHRVYLHRALAEAFVPNPDNYNTVFFRDDNQENVSVDNLIWGKVGTQYEMLKKNRKTYGCNVCGSTEKVSLNKDFICFKCYRRKKAMEMRIEKFKEEMKGISSNLLNNQQKKIYDMRMQGMRDSEIAEKLGVTRQDIHYHIKRIKEEQGIDKNMGQEK